jgi:DNA polymerase-4
MHSNIIHIDVTNFPIAVERVVEPRLYLRPVAVAVQTATQPLVLAASEEAQQNGVYRGQSLYKALKNCRELTVLPPNEELYRRASHALMQLLSQYTPVLEPLRFGHAYLDMTGTRKLFGEPPDTAAKVQRDIKNRLRLGAAAGIATNKLVSKVASDFVTYRGPRFGLYDVERGEEEKFLAPLSVNYLPGIHKKVRAELNDLNVKINKELAAIPVEHLQMIFGRTGMLLHQRAKGIDPRPVQPPKRAPEIVEIEQLTDPSNDVELLQSMLFELLSRATLRLRNKRLRSGRLVLHIQYSDFKENAAQQRFTPLNSEIELTAPAKQMLQRILSRRVRVRKMTLRLCDLTAEPVQLSLFPQDPQIDQITSVMDQIRDKYGDRAIRFGRTINKAA